MIRRSETIASFRTPEKAHVPSDMYFDQEFYYGLLHSFSFSLYHVATDLFSGHQSFPYHVMKLLSISMNIPADGKYKFKVRLNPLMK